MTPLEERLREFRFFRALDDHSVRRFAERGSWFSLAGGSELFRQGSRSNALFFVLAGRLVVVRQRGGTEEVVGYVRAGEPVGEMSLLSGEAHSASVYALRDTELVSLAGAEVEDIMERDADLAIVLARSVLARARRPQDSQQRSAPRVFALIATSPSIDVDRRARDIAAIIEELGLSVRRLGESDGDFSPDFEALEGASDVVLLATRVGDTFLFRFTLRHADRFYVLARRDARPPRPFPLALEENSPAKRFRLVDLVMLEEGVPAAAVRDWSDAVGANRIFHWADDSGAARIARAIAGKTVGLVLSGGGARAYAHVGAIRALREAGVPIDFIAGASMGAIVGACAAMGWDDAEIDRRIRMSFVASNPLGDHVLPVVALTRGRLVEQRLEQNFGDALIEEMKIPFLCVSSELTTGAVFVHREGLVRKALRASISIPGILPPVAVADRLYVDGAVVDNFPTDLMSETHRGVTIGVDVARKGSIDAADFINPPGFLQWIWRNGFRSAPPIVTLLMRSATARVDQMPKGRAPDILVTPEAPGVALRDWKKYDIAVEDGYRAMKREIAEHWGLLRPLARP
ncbi:MAG: patatin-like phospholipase family protein [Parvularculaceae bacterium]|nr:patatin-like phospholipase family protein [Parvularculaceae bacterium]